MPPYLQVICKYTIILSMETLCNAALLLKSNGMRVTPARVLLLEALHSGRGLFTAQELHGFLPAGSADLVTVYRFLALLVKARLAREVAGTDGVAYYEMACRHNPVHPHFECLGCGRILCLPVFLEEDSDRVYAYGEGHDIESVSVVFRGTCSECLAKAEKEEKG